MVFVNLYINSIICSDLLMTYKGSNKHFACSQYSSSWKTKKNCYSKGRWIWTSMGIICHLHISLSGSCVSLFIARLLNGEHFNRLFFLFAYYYQIASVIELQIRIDVIIWFHISDVYVSINKIQISSIRFFSFLVHSFFISIIFRKVEDRKSR